MRGERSEDRVAEAQTGRWCNVVGLELKSLSGSCSIILHLGHILLSHMGLIGLLVHVHTCEYILINLLVF